jgi:hypothetical protein
LDLQRAFDRLGRGWKLGETIVAREVDDPSSVLADEEADADSGLIEGGRGSG